jgi:ribonuclease HII
MLIVGVDENGLGPILGPLVVTATAFRADRYAPEPFWQLCAAGLHAADSKKVFHRGQFARAEEWALRWLRVFGIDATDGRALESSICLPISEPCPDLAPRICRTGRLRPLPAWTPSLPIVDDAATLPFRTGSIQPLCTRAISVCPGAYNAALTNSPINKLEYDFHLMITLVRELQQRHPGEPTLALCGKIGSTRCYLSWLHKAGIAALAQTETPAESTYRAGDLTISFIRDGDGSHLPIAVASIIGKYLRELALLDLNDRLDNLSHPASGYRDGVTSRFIVQSRSLRSASGLPDRCFLRSR